MSSIKTAIAAAVTAKLEEITALRYVSFEDIKVGIAQFKDHEFPAVQLFDVGQTNQHVRGLLDVEWFFALELFMRQSRNDSVDQTALWDLMEEIELKLFEDPDFGIAGVKHLKYDSVITDLHAFKPIYMARFDFSIEFSQQLRPC
jgi:hypothetical protein